MLPLAPGVTLLPSAGTCFRTWHPARGPLRSLLKHEKGGGYFWLIGPPAALWEAVEPGITLGRLRARAQALQVGDHLDPWLLEWHQAGWLDLRGLAPGDPPASALVAARPEAASGAADLRSAPSACLIPTDLAEVERWMSSQGLPFSASWALDHPDQDLRQVVERLDFLRRSGVFRIHFTVQTPSPGHQHIRLAARAQGFECMGPDQ